MSTRLLTKRRFPRRRYHWPIGILVDGKYELAPGDEVGEGGVSFFSPTKIADGKQVLITLALEGELHCMRGEVRYQYPRGERSLIGVAFQGITFKYKKLIRRYIGAKTEAESIQVQAVAVERRREPRQE